MRAVVDAAGRRSLLLREHGEQAVLRDVETGERRTASLEDLASLDGGPLGTLVTDVPPSLPSPLDRAPTDRALALLVELHVAGPRPVRDLLADTTLCESDLHGLVGDLRAAGLVQDEPVAGERGYDLTPSATAAMVDLESRT